MQQNNPILSIAIPTRNRAHYLKLCLEHIVLAFSDERIKNVVEVVISDNDSQDNTQDLAKEYQAKYSNIKYFRNEKNIGFDGNVVNSVTKSNGKYVWHIGDDDFIQNGAISFIVDFLSQKDVAILSVNFYPFVDHQKSLALVSDITLKNIVYSNSPEEYYHKGHCQGILGIFILHKELWHATQKQITKYEGLGIYYEIILRMLPGAPLPLAHLNYPVLFTGQDYKWNKNGTALFTYLYNVRLIKRLIAYSYSQAFVDGQIDLFSKSLVVVVLKAKATDLKYSLHNLSLIYHEFYQYPLQLCLATLVYFLPNWLIKFLKNFKNQLKT